jgi:hypothetical protein
MLHSTLFNLEQITQLVSRSRKLRETPEWPHISIKTIDYGDGLFKIAVSSLRNRPGMAGRKRAEVGQERSELSSDAMARGARRAQTALRDVIIASRCNSMLTFTARDGVTRDELIASVGDFVIAMRAIGHEFPLILVPETHHGGGGNDGTQHGHAAVALPQFIDYKLFHGAWNAALRRNVPRLKLSPIELSQGTVNVSPRSNSPMSLAKYLAKYISKDFLDGIAHKKRYVCYGPVRRVTRTVLCAPADEFPPLADVVRAAMRLTGARDGWQIDSQYSQVFLSDNLWPALAPDGPEAGRPPGGLSVGRPPAPHPAHVLAEAAFITVGGSEPQTDEDREIDRAGVMEHFAGAITTLAEPLGVPAPGQDREARVYSDDDFVDEDY